LSFSLFNSPVLCGLFLRWGLENYLPKLALNRDPPDYWHEPQALAWVCFVNSRSNDVIQAEILLPQPPECWDYRHAPQHSALCIISYNYVNLKLLRIKSLI
jgi:hypothetical protein